MDDYISFATKGFLLRNCWMTSGSLHHINVLEHDTERGRVYVAVLLRSDRLTCFCVQTRKVWLCMISCICVRGPSSYFAFAAVFVRAVR